MRLQLLGTGSSDGWPNPWCGCASCRAAAAAGIVRGQSSALVDGRLLLEIGPEAPRSALRHGLDLTGVEAVLVTHAHPDHHGWPAWMWRGWVRGRRQLTLVAPPAVVEEASHTVDDAVTVVPVTAGDEVTVAGYGVRVLPANHAEPTVGPAVLYDVTGPDGARLLWATDTGKLPEAMLELAAGRAYDAVLLELTGVPTPHHLTLDSWPLQVAELRRRGAVTDTTRLMAVHMGHDNPPPAELAEILAGWGAHAPVDGEVVEICRSATGGGVTSRAAPAARRVLVLGGARSGKSVYAERRLAAEPAVTYVATAPPAEDDAEWRERVQAHRDRRPAGWRTVETGDVAAVLRQPPGPLLVDDLGLWLTRVVDAAGAWDGPLPEQVERACDDLVDAWRACPGTAVLVANLVGSGVVPATPSGRRFRDLLGIVTARLAAGADEVVELVAGLPRRLR